MLKRRIKCKIKGKKQRVNEAKIGTAREPKIAIETQSAAEIGIERITATGTKTVINLISKPQTIRDDSLTSYLDIVV